MLRIVGTEDAGLESGEQMAPQRRVHRADFVEATADAVADGLAGFLTATATLARTTVQAIGNS